MSIPDSTRNFGLFEALTGRRSRRFGLGMSIPNGPLQYTSRYEPVPLSDDERALLAFAAAGVTGWHLGMPHTASGDPEAGANYAVRYLGRTAPSGAGIESSEVLLTDDTGTYITQTRSLTSEQIAEVAKSRSLDELLEHAKGHLAQISTEPVRLPAEPPYVFKHNYWDALQPGTTLLAPVLDLTEQALALLSMVSGEGTVLWDPEQDQPIGNPEALLAAGLLNPEARLPLLTFETFGIQQADFELSLLAYNAQLALQALGLGGWLFGGIDINSLLGAYADQGIRGFGVQFQTVGPDQVPNPVGLPGYFETLFSPFSGSAREGVERFVSRKFGATGIYDAATSPYKDSAITKRAERYTDDVIDYFISVVEDVVDRYGRFPGTGPSVLAGIYTQAHHLDLDYYEQFHHPQAVLDTHRNHFRDWHDGAEPQLRSA